MRSGLGESLDWWAVEPIVAPEAQRTYSLSSLL